MVEIKFWDHGNGREEGAASVGAKEPTRTMLSDEIDDSGGQLRHHHHRGSGSGSSGHRRRDSDMSEETAHDYWCGIKIDTIQFSISVAICYGASLGGMATLTGVFSVPRCLSRG